MCVSERAEPAVAFFQFIAAERTRLLADNGLIAVKNRMQRMKKERLGSRLIIVSSHRRSGAHYRDAQLR